MPDISNPDLEESLFENNEENGAIKREPNHVIVQGHISKRTPEVS
jgi:hypothetical protein